MNGMAACSRLVVFGDGLSDQGRSGGLTGNRCPPSPPLADGRWTDGPTWVEVLAERSGIPLASADGRAQGGATSGALHVNAPLRDLVAAGSTPRASPSKASP
jgi:phospholipase/lecithinase/hemolysin